MPFPCDAAFYQIRTDGSDTYLFRFPTIEPNVRPLNVYGDETTLAVPLSGLGFNPVDNYLYAISTAQNPDRVVYRIGQSGAEIAGTIPTDGATGVPASAAIVTGATFDSAGRYYFAYRGGDNPRSIFRVDTIPASGSITLNVARNYAYSAAGLNNSAGEDFGDIAFAARPISNEGINGLLYGTTGGSHYRIELSDRDAIAFVFEGVVTPPVGAIGAAFYDRSTDQYYVYENRTNTFFRINNFNSRSATFTRIVALSPSVRVDISSYTTTDGASCILAGAQRADLQLTKSATPSTPVMIGQTVTFTVVVRNGGTNTVGTVTVADPLPFGFAFVSASATTGAYATPTWTIPGIAVNTTASLTIVATANNSTATSTATYVNRATITSIAQASTTSFISVFDPTLGNNSSSATVTLRIAANLSISKDNGATTVAAGSTTNYTIIVSNLAPSSDLANSVLRDPAATGLSCVIGTPPCGFTGPAGSVCPAVGGGAGELNIGNLQGRGVTIPLLKSGGSMNFTVSCLVTATGD